MKAAIKYVPLALLACLLTVACESGGGSGTAAIGGHLIGSWSGTYVIKVKGSGSRDLKVYIHSQTEDRFRGELRESPVDDDNFEGTIREDGDLIINSTKGLEMSGSMCGESEMTGTYNSSGGEAGYWVLNRN